MVTKNTVAYQYILKAERSDNGDFHWLTDSVKIEKLLLGVDWKPIFTKYNNRQRFYWGFSVSGCGGDELFPLIDFKIELIKASLKNPEFMLEAAVMPGKLDSEQRSLFDEAMALCIEEPEFKIWWDDDPRGPRKRKLKVKKKLLEEILKIKAYSGEDDLKLEDAKVSLEEAKEFFGFSDLKKLEIRSIFKKKLKEMQLKCHPDSETGDEESFLFLQKCRSIMEKWLKS